MQTLKSAHKSSGVCVRERVPEPASFDIAHLQIENNACLSGDTSKMERCAAATQRILAKLTARIEAGDYYEAHQMYRTLHFRLLAKNNHVELMELLFKGADLFLSRDQQQSGVDLAILYVDVAAKAKVAPEKDVVDRVSLLLSKMDPAIAERDTFVNNAIRWGKGEGQCGSTLLHKNFGLVLWQQKNYPLALVNFYNSDDAVSLAKMLIEMNTTKSTPEDVGAGVAVAVLQMLCKQRKELASETFAYYIKNHPGVCESKPPFKAELINFTWYLLQMIDKRNSEQFTELVLRYDLSIKEYSYTEYLKKIGRVYFGIPSQKSSHNGILGNLIQNIMSGMETDESAFEEMPVAPTLPKMQTEDVE